MGLLKRIAQWGWGKTSSQPLPPTQPTAQATLRRCQFEVMEQRRVLSADPVVAGITYLETDGGQDLTPDRFEVTFQGGSSTTQLNSFTINGDQDGSGAISRGDMVFHTSPTAAGGVQSHGFQFDAANSHGILASDIESVVVSPDGLSLTVQIKNFTAGDKLVFTIDVDERELNRFDPIASGVEFEGARFTANFEDAHYQFQSREVTAIAIADGLPQQQQSGVFFDYYDNLFQSGANLSGTPLDLEADNFNGHENRSAGTIDVYDLVAKPVKISGRVYHDENTNCNFDGTEQGIGGVGITLQRWNAATNQFQTVAQTTTNANGVYEFGLDLNLQPGDYRVVESQPSGYLSVGATPGTVAGGAVGTVITDAFGSPNILGNISIPLGGTHAVEYNFCEVRPASIAGKVWHDRNDNGKIDSGEEGIANVMIQVTRIGAKDTSIPDPFAGFNSIFVRTAADGSYQVDLLPPGLYEIIEINNYPASDNPLATFVDGKDSVGRVGTTVNGIKANDRFHQIELCADDAGVEYNFGELKPTSISGYVSITTPEGDCLDPNDPDHRGIAGVTIQLFDQAGNLVRTTQTNADGFYQFTGLGVGTYSVVEVQPAGYLDAGDSLGSVNGSTVGVLTTNDKFSNISLMSGQSGTNYNFCEHEPAQICGTVWHDLNDNGIRESGEQGIGGVLIELYDVAGNKLSEVRTAADGSYCFDNLLAGNYCVKEVQPTAFTDGKESLGKVSGTAIGVASNDKFTAIIVKGGQSGTNYDFGEIRLSSISGFVHADIDGNCVYSAAAGDRPLANVTMLLLNSQGQEIARTLTDAQGNYAFNGLRPGNYSVAQVQPQGYLNGGEMIGTINGVTVGTTQANRIAGITLTSGQNAVKYDFCEHIPSELCGYVFHDLNNDGVRDAGETGIANTQVRLFDATGKLVAETLTDSNGQYCFKELIAGEYCVKEVQPTGWTDGKDLAGRIDSLRVGQTINNDEHCKVVIKGGQKGTEYNFGEIKLASISGFVHTDLNGNCVFENAAGDRPLVGVTMQLLDQNGNVMASATTDNNGAYKFDNLLPGTYSVRQVQPNDYFDVGQVVGKLSDGTAGPGSAGTQNLLSNITVNSGQVLVQYNFCEDVPAQLSGRVWEDGPVFQTSDGQVPVNYRDQRDGIYQAGVDQPLAGIRMQLYYYIDPTSGNIAPRPVTLADVLPGHYKHLGSDPSTPIYVTTDANGQYSFTGLRAGNYIVIQQQPTGYVDANEIAGSTTGFTYNTQISASTAPQSVLQIFSTQQVMDSIVNIRVNAGGVSVQNNFTEVRAQALPDDPQNPWLPPTPPQRFGNPTPPNAHLAFYGGLAGSQPSSFNQFVGTQIGVRMQIGSSQPGYTWHLSVINAGQPRSAEEVEPEQTLWLQASFLNTAEWNRADMNQAAWTFATVDASGHAQVLDQHFRYGPVDGIPVTGDFTGDGKDEIAVFKNGYWMIDLNGNGRWDEQDLMCQLGDEQDRPITGDWDGDGKADIGIFGPMWQKDLEAIVSEPGLPNPDNMPFTKPKNVPPHVAESSSGARYLKLTSHGKQRADLVDHVFGVDDPELVPLAGDFNGNGIRSIASFHSGTWRLDVNGDGRFDERHDIFATFGQAGDLPVVGDFNGDGIEQIAVFRNGTWIIDSNNNYQMDDADQRVILGRAGDVPVVGDWNGDGQTDVGLYQNRGFSGGL